MALRFDRLSRTAIRALVAGERITQHGIIVERLKTGDIRYAVNVMIDGQRIHRVIGKESEGVTREQAERAIESFRTKAREGRLNLPASRKTHRTFQEASETYLQYLEGTLFEGAKGFHDLPNKKRNLNLHLIPFFKGHCVDKITELTVKKYVRQRIDAKAQAATVNRELATLSHLMNRMVEWKWIRADDRPKIDKEEEKRKKIVILTVADQSALLKGGIEDQDPAAWLFIAYGQNTAMRHSEMLRTRWDAIDFDNHRIHVPEAKAGQRIQPMTTSLARMLADERKRRDDQEGYIFSPTSKNCKTPYRKTMADQFQRAVIRAGLDPKKVTPHVMRHTAITRLVQAGVDLPTIKRISGHKTLEMVLRYVHLTDEHIDIAIAAIDTGMFDEITPELHTLGNRTKAKRA